MSKRQKWVVFPDGAAGLHRIVLNDDRRGLVLTVAETDEGQLVANKARVFGFLPVPGVDNTLHFTPEVGSEIPFTMGRLAKALDARVSDISKRDMEERTFGKKEVYEPAFVAPEEIIPVRPVKIAVNAMGETVVQAENGRFVRIERMGEEAFIAEPASGSKARFLRATTVEDLAPIGGAVFKEVNQSFSGVRMDQIIRFAMEPRTDEEAPAFTFDEARAIVRKDLIKQVMESSVVNDASRGAWHDTSRLATFMNSAIVRETRADEALSPSLQLMMLIHRLSRKYHSVDFMGSEDLSLAVPGRREDDAPLSILDLSTIPDGQRMSYVINRMARRQEKGRTMMLMPISPDSDEAMAIRSSLGTVYGVESVLSMPHVVADGTAGSREWTLMVFGDKRPEPLDTLPVAALRTMKAINADDLLSFEREINRSVDRLREFNTGEQEEVERAERDEVKANDHQVPYVAMSKVSEPETMLPYSLQGAVSIAQGKVMRLMEETGGVDATVANSMGISISEMSDIMSAEQVDSVAYWLYSTAKDQKGFACLDGTGVGKTRSNLGIARAFLRMGDVEGRNRKIFYLTESTMNAPDIVKEMHEMGMGHLRVGVLTSPFKSAIEVKGENGKAKTIPVNALSKKEKDTIYESQEFPEEFDVIISTFSTFNSTAPTSASSTWAHNAFAPHIMMIADEAQNAINVKSNTGRNIQAMRRPLPDNQFISSTATPYKTPEEVLAYDFLIPKSAGDPEEIINAVVKGKEAAQEAFTTMLAQDGSITRRTRSLASVNFKAHLPDDERMRHNQQVMSSFSDLAARMLEESVRIKGRVEEIVQENMQAMIARGLEPDVAMRAARDQNKNSESFGNALSRLTNMILVGLRVQGIYPQIQKDMAAGVKPVISFEHTMMDLFTEADAAGEDLTNLTMRDQIRRIQERIYTVTVNDQKVDIRTLDPNIAASSAAIQQTIDAFPELPASPIDWLMDRLAEEGVSSGELSGRSVRYSNGQLEKRSKDDRDKRAVVDKFNSGELDVLFHNKTGATGVSFHAHKNFRDQRPRSTYIIAAFSEVIKMLQGFGRTDRKEQTSNPTINWVMTGLIGETRSFQQINSRLRKLGASVDANRNHPMLIAEVPDLLNKVGDRAFLNVLRNRPDFAQRMDVEAFLNQDQERVVDDREDAISATSIANLANTCMSRMVMLRDEEQNQLMDSVQLEFDALIEELDARNANPLKPKMVDGEIIITSKVVYQGEEAMDGDYDRSAFLDPLYLCTGVQRIEGRTFGGDDVMARVERCRRLQGADGLETWAQTVRTAMPNILRRYLPDGINYVQAAANPEMGGDRFRTKFEVIDRMVRTMESIKPGMTIRMPMIDDLWETPNSYVITDIVPPPNMLEAGNAAAYKIKVVAPGEISERQVTLKRIMDLKEEEVVFHIGLSRGDNPDLRRAFDEASSDVYERPVQILNGNLLKAIVTSISHGLGTPCLYKDAESGQLMKGIVITDKKLDLRRLPVDVRDQGAAEVMIRRRKDDESRTALLNIVGCLSNVKNDYNFKDPSFFMTGTKTHLIVGYTFNRSTYPFFRDRPDLYRALTGEALPPLRDVRSSRSPRMCRLSYNAGPQSEQRISGVIDGMFTRLDGDDQVNMNLFISGSHRDEMNEIIQTRGPQFAPAKIEEIKIPVAIVAETPHSEPKAPLSGVVEINGEEEEISWDS